jgi:hypothetical protein
VTREQARKGAYHRRESRLCRAVHADREAPHAMPLPCTNGRAGD